MVCDVGGWPGATGLASNRLARHADCTTTVMADLARADCDHLVYQVRIAIRDLAERGYVDDTSATLALLALDLGHRRVIAADADSVVPDVVDRSNDA